MIVSAVPRTSHTVTDLPFLFRRWDGDDGAYELVAETLDVAMQLVSSGLARTRRK